MLLPAQGFLHFPFPPPMGHGKWKWKSAPITPLSTIYLVFTPPVPTIYLGNGPTEKRGGPQYSGSGESVFTGGRFPATPTPGRGDSRP